MRARPRPILSVRLIGPAEIVTIHKVRLIAQLSATYGHHATCRTSTHPASHAGETRAYITVSGKEDYERER
jgi:hypothetical protein